MFIRRQFVGCRITLSEPLINDEIMSWKKTSEVTVFPSKTDENRLKMEKLVVNTSTNKTVLRARNCFRALYDVGLKISYHLGKDTVKA